MSGDSVLLDTNVVLYLLNGDDELAFILQDAKVFLSVISKVELLCHPALDDSGKRVILDF